MRSSVAFRPSRMDGRNERSTPREVRPDRSNGEDEGLTPEPTCAQSAAAPVEPITAIVDAFRSHTLVALGEVHGREADQTVRLALIHDPRLPSVVDDIVVEFGSAEFQDVKDRFLAGDAVSEEVLQKVCSTPPRHSINRCTKGSFGKCAR